MDKDIEKILDGLPEKVCNGELSPNEAMLVIEYLGDYIIEEVLAC